MKIKCSLVHPNVENILLNLGNTFGEIIWYFIENGNFVTNFLLF